MKPHTILCLLLLAAALIFTSKAWADDQISAAVGSEKVKQGALLIDVRSADEFGDGHVNGAINIPHDQIAKHFAEIGSDKSREIVLYCRSGRRSGVAQKTLQENGYQRVFNSGGYADWIKLEDGAQH